MITNTKLDSNSEFDNLPVEKYKKMYNEKSLWWRIKNKLSWKSKSLWAALTSNVSPGEMLITKHNEGYRYLAEVVHKIIVDYNEDFDDQLDDIPSLTEPEKLATLISCVVQNLNLDLLEACSYLDSLEKKEK